jgi:hypothetical protein
MPRIGHRIQSISITSPSPSPVPQVDQLVHGLAPMALWMVYLAKKKVQSIMF